MFLWQYVHFAYIRVVSCWVLCSYAFNVHLQDCFIFVKSPASILWLATSLKQWTWHSSWRERSFWLRCALMYVYHTYKNIILFCCLQKLHLPPELSETASRSQEDTKTIPNRQSNLSLSKKIDFWVSVQSGVHELQHSWFSLLSSLCWLC